MKPNIAHTIINGEPRFEQAHRMLFHALQNLGPAKERIPAERTERMRRALGFKVRQALLLAAFKETDDAHDRTLQELSTRAESLIENPSWSLSVAEYVYRAYGLQDNTDVHPPMEEVQHAALVSAQKIARVLSGETTDKS